ncbi:MAG TPA: phytanoyl-CoA dioxygenase family protein [Thermoanaerobaculia bacterium]|nr:phytanoyl-CoA dioxygenase family protein [Thermoanaerobaculia bacterium]
MSSVAGLEADGHALVRGLLPPEEAASYRPLIRRIVEEVSQRADRQGRIDDYSRLFNQVTNIWRLDDGARRIVFDRRFAAAAARILGVESVRLYHDQALFKPPGAARTPWHQDRYYWPLDTDRSVTMWLPLVDVTEEMGPMIFASGSHRGGDFGEVSISEETDRRLAALIAERGWPLWTAPVAAGDATFHLGGTLHSAGANRSGTTREVLTVIYYAAGTRAAVPANENQRVDLEVFLPGVRPGEEAASELNPVLWPAESARSPILC